MDLIVGGPSLGVGTAIKTTAAAYNTSVSAATSRPAVIAVKSAANAVTAGVTAANWAGSAVYQGARFVFGSGNGGGGSALANSASQVSPPSNPNSPSNERPVV
jgi:hypothetical protein